MAKSSNKSKEMSGALNEISDLIFGRTRTESISGDVCVTCGGKADTFRNDMSKKEYSIGGMCQGCQDSVFGKD